MCIKNTYAHTYNLYNRYDIQDQKQQQQQSQRPQQQAKMSNTIQTQTQQAPRKKRIIINIDKSSKKQKQTFQQKQKQKFQTQKQSESMFNANKELPKLFQISERCFHYYDKFKEDRLEEEQYADIMFGDLLAHLQRSFRELYESIANKENQIKNCVREKKRQFMQFHPQHFLSLTQKIQIIKQQKSSLQKSLTPSIFSSNYSASQCQIKQSELSQFAKLLNQFYCQIETIERVNFKQNIRESISFLRNLIEDQCLSYVNRRIGGDPTLSIHENISFNNQQLFSVKEFGEESGQAQWDQFRLNTERVQRDRELKIQVYTERMSKMLVC